MSKVDADLAALIDFRSHLIRYDHQLADEFAGIRSHWRDLGGVWTDAKYRDLGAALDEVNKGIERYLAAADGHEAHLLRLIEHLRAFLDEHV